MRSRVWILALVAFLLPVTGEAGRSDITTVEAAAAPLSSVLRPGYPFPSFVTLDDELHEFSDEDYVWTLAGDLRGVKAGGDWVGSGIVEVWPTIDAYQDAPDDPPCIITQDLVADSLPTPPALTCPGCSVYHQVEAVGYTTSGVCDASAVSRLVASYRWRYQGYRDAATAGWPNDLDDIQGAKAQGYRGVVYSTDLTVDEGGGFSRYYLVRLD